MTPGIYRIKMHSFCKCKLILVFQVSDRLCIEIPVFYFTVLFVALHERKYTPPENGIYSVAIRCFTKELHISDN